MKTDKRTGSARRFAKRAGAALVLAGTAFMLCSNPPKTGKGAEMKPLASAPSSAPAAREQRKPGTVGILRRDLDLFKIAAEHGAKLDKPGADARKKLAEIFPYDGLDCTLIPRETIGKQSEQAGENKSTELNKLTELFDEASIQMRSLSDDIKRGSRVSASLFRPLPKLAKPFEPFHKENEIEANSLKRLTEYLKENGLPDEANEIGSGSAPEKAAGTAEEIGSAAEDDGTHPFTRLMMSLADSGDLDGAVSVLEELNSLNLRWQDESGEDNDLYHVYSLLKARAEVKDFSSTIDSGCLDRIYAAMEAVHESLKTMGHMLSERPDSAERILNGLKADQRLEAMEGSFEWFVFGENDSPNPDYSPIETFYNMLSDGNRELFLSALSEFRAHNKKDVAWLEGLARSTEIPALRESAAAALPRWVGSQKFFDDAMSH